MLYQTDNDSYPTLAQLKADKGAAELSEDVDGLTSDNYQLFLDNKDHLYYDYCNGHGIIIFYWDYTKNQQSDDEFTVGWCYA